MAIALKHLTGEWGDTRTSGGNLKVEGPEATYLKAIFNFSKPNAKRTEMKHRLQKKKKKKKESQCPQPEDSGQRVALLSGRPCSVSAVNDFRSSLFTLFFAFN